MKIRQQDVLIPTSMVGNYPNPRWWDAAWLATSTATGNRPIP